MVTVVVVVVVGAFPMRFCPPRFTANLGVNPSFSMFYLPRNKRLSTITSTSTTRDDEKKKRHRFACSNGVELEEAEVEIEIESAGKNMRSIVARVAVEAPLSAVWDVLTDYEALSDFIPGLSESRLLLQSPSYARLFQVGEQKLGLGIKFNAKGIVDCFEKDLEVLPSGGLARDIEFDMVQGDFEVFQGKWSILQESTTTTQSVLSYSVRVKPKLWLPVKLVEGILCKEIKVNLASIRGRTLQII